MSEHGIWARLRRIFRDTRERPHYVFNRIGGLRVHQVWDPNTVHKILTDTETFGRLGFAKKALSKIIGHALIVEDGDSWTAKRRLMAAVFTPKMVLENIAPVALKEVDDMIDRWLAKAEPVDVEREMRALTGTVIMKTIFGDDITNQDADEIIDAASTTVQSFREPHWMVKLLRVSGMDELMARAGHPYDYAPPTKQAYIDAAARIDSIIYRLINQRRGEPNPHDDLLTRLINARDPETGEGMDDKTIRDQIIMLIVAGHETTSVGLTFALNEILKHPDVQKNIRDEFNAVTRGRALAGRDYQKMNYTQNAFKESLRLHPPAYVMVREVKEDKAVDGADFRERDVVRMDILKMHYDEDFWPDAKVYKPERFNETAFPRAWMPFGGGPRLCLGMTMALVEGTLALSRIFNRLDMEVLQEPTGKQFVFTMRPVGKLEIGVSPRNPEPR